MISSKSIQRMCLPSFEEGRYVTSSMGDILTSIPLERGVELNPFLDVLIKLNAQ